MKLAGTISRLAVRIGIVSTVVLASALVVAAPAQAFPPRDWCGPSTAGQLWYDINSAEINPTLTHFMSINIAPGTTGERTETLTKVNTVSTSLGLTTEISSTAGAIFAKVAVKVGFSVQYTTSSTDTESTSMRWTFNEPGYYGLYKGTRAVSGTYTAWRCIRNTLPPIGTAYNVWRVTDESYTTFDNVEVGTIRCGDEVPAGSLRFTARLQLGC